MSKGCKLDTDGDGNCFRHPDGCSNELPDPEKVAEQITDELREGVEEHLSYLDSLSNQTEELGELIEVAQHNFDHSQGNALNLAMSVNVAKHLRRISERLDLIAADLRTVFVNGCVSNETFNCNDPGIHSGIEINGQPFEPEEI